MADSQQNIDWTALRQTASQCLSAAWDLICWAERSQNNDYDVERAALHLAAIDRACDTLTRAIRILSSRVFDPLAQAVIGEGPRPDFQFGGVCCATAHESGFVLLRSAVLRIELDLEALRIGSIEQLHDLSPADLHAVLVELGSDAVQVHDGPRAEWSRVAQPLFRMANVPLQSLLTDQQLNVVHAWIDREWAAMSNDGKRDVVVLPQQPDVDEDRAPFGFPIPKTQETAVPIHYLTSWREILLALGMKNNNEDREKVRNLNAQYNGPIVIPKQGAQPKVDKAKLIEWWNGLEAQWTVGYQRGRDARPTVEAQHPYGRDDMAAPGISGGVKKRRKDRRA